ncbi:MAG: oligosaccharide flippase family protein, partial [Gammaproteobacteria bacterium]
MEAGKIVSNVIWLVSDRVFRLGANFLLTLWIARHFGPEGFGELSYLLALVAVLGSFAALGLNTVVVRDLVQQSAPDRVRETLGSAVALQAAGGVLAFLLMAAYCLWPRAEIHDSPYPGLVLAATLLLQPCAVLRYWFESRLQSRYSVMADNAAFVASAGVKVLVLLNEGPLVWISAALLIEAMVGACCLAFLFSARGTSHSILVASMRRARSLLSDAWPLMLSG